MPLTLPSHASILTGLLPSSHGVHENGLDRLAPDRDTLGVRFKAAGYRTAAFVGAFVLDRRFGLARGFDEYDDRIGRDRNDADRLETERPANVVVDAALRWLNGLAGPKGPAPQESSSRAPGAQQQAAASPFFVWVHLYDPHAPYSPPREYAARAASGYDGEVMFADAQAGRLLDWLAAAHVESNTIVVVAGDHGEALGDHGERTHGMLLYDSTLRVPLIVSAPGRRPGRRTDPVSLVDIAPTLFRLAGPAAIDGRDLFDQSASRTLYSETDYPRVAGWSPLRALTDGRWMAIRGESSAELYDLAVDPAEAHDAAAAQASTTRAFVTRMDAFGAGRRRALTEVPAETAERLRALGYVAGSPQQPTRGRAPSPVVHMPAWNGFEDAVERLNAGDKGATAALRGIAAQNPDAMVFATTAARALRERGALVEALGACRDAAARWPTEATVLHDVAVTAAELASRSHAPAKIALEAEAAKAEQAALALRPDYAAAHNGLGLLAVSAGRDADARTDFERATDLDPTNATYWANLGNARRADGEAIGWFERALAADPHSVDARLNLGIALQENGDRIRAAAAYRAVLQASTTYERQRDAARKLLASLERTPYPEENGPTSAVRRWKTIRGPGRERTAATRSLRRRRSRPAVLRRAGRSAPAACDRCRGRTRAPVRTGDRAETRRRTRRSGIRSLSARSRASTRRGGRERRYRATILTGRYPPGHGARDNAGDTGQPEQRVGQIGFRFSF